MLVNGCVLATRDLRIRSDQVTRICLPSQAQSVLPLRRRFEIRVEIDNFEVATVAGRDLCDLLRGHTVTGPTNGNVRLTKLVGLFKEIHTTNLRLHRRSIGVREHI